jgi:hypothetical protein
MNKSQICARDIPAAPEPRYSGTSLFLRHILCVEIVLLWLLDLVRLGHVPRVDSASNRNEYQESSWDKGRPARKADNLAVMCEPIV